jgi:L-ribulose-5-phosphate 3-epimerase UlaE
MKKVLDLMAARWVAKRRRPFGIKEMDNIERREWIFHDNIKIHDDIGIAMFLDPRFKLLDFSFPDHDLFSVTKFRHEIRSTFRLALIRDWKRIDD